MASGRQRALLHNKPRLPCHPSTLVGVPVVFLFQTQRSGLRVSRCSLATPSQAAALRLHAGLLLCRPPGSEFRALRAPVWALQIPIYCAEGASSKMLLIFLFSAKSLGHVCTKWLRIHFELENRGLLRFNRAHEDACICSDCCSCRAHSFLLWRVRLQFV